MFVYDRIMLKKKEIGEKYLKNLIVFNCYRYWIIKRLKVKIYLKYFFWIYVKVKKSWILFGLYD